MVESTRGSPYGLAWELYAGCQSITQSLSQCGWICAPPVDVAYSEWFNLNPAFVSIVVGIILEGRITLLIMDPPVGDDPQLNQAILDVSGLVVTLCGGVMGPLWSIWAIMSQ